MKIILTIYDKVTKLYEGLSVFDNMAVAKRYLIEVQDKIPYFNDKEFYVVGEFNIESGAVLPFDKENWQVIVIE